MLVAIVVVVVAKQSETLNMINVVSVDQSLPDIFSWLALKMHEITNRQKRMPDRTDSRDGQDTQQPLGSASIFAKL